jgi:hypothetical protein
VPTGEASHHSDLALSIIVIHAMTHLREIVAKPLGTQLISLGLALIMGV